MQCLSLNYDAESRSAKLQHETTINVHDANQHPIDTYDILGCSSLRKLFCVENFPHHGSVIHRVEPSSGHVEVSWSINLLYEDIRIVGEDVIVTDFTKLDKYDQDGHLLQTFDSTIRGGYHILRGVTRPGTVMIPLLQTETVCNVWLL